MTNPVEYEAELQICGASARPDRGDWPCDRVTNCQQRSQYRECGDVLLFLLSECPWRQMLTYARDSLSFLHTPHNYHLNDATAQHAHQSSLLHQEVCLMREGLGANNRDQSFYI